MSRSCAKRRSTSLSSRRRHLPALLRTIVSLVLVCLCSASNSLGYSVLTHEEIIDLAWNSSIKPLLLAKFPGTTDDQLRDAHAYAYGGSAIQDMGYYPFGKKFFSNLTHYIRTGDFIEWMFRNAHNVNEYAFAIGALSHYRGDSIGHERAVNPATAVEFPKLRKEYGDIVTYGETPHGHIRTEFAFDIDELRDAAFAPPPYLRYIGFKVPRKFLEDAFRATYGFDIHDILGRARPALRSYRTSVRSFIPAFAEAEVVLHGNQFPPHPHDEVYRVFAERVARTNYERSWKHTYHGRGIRAHLLAIVVFLLPKVGAISDLAIKIPSPETQEWYLRSVNRTVDVFQEDLKNLLNKGEAGISFANLDLDTGARAHLGDYKLADQTYAELLARLTSRSQEKLSASLKQHLLEYYAEASKEENIPNSILSDIEKLRQMQPREPRHGERTIN